MQIDKITGVCQIAHDNTPNIIRNFLFGIIDNI